MIGKSWWNEQGILYLCSTQSKWYTFELFFGILLRYHLHRADANNVFVFISYIFVGFGNIPKR